MTGPTPHQNSQLNTPPGEAAHAASPGAIPPEASPTVTAEGLQPPSSDPSDSPTGPETGKPADSSKSKKTAIAITVTSVLALGIAGLWLAQGAKESPMEQAMANCQGSKSVTYVAEHISGSKATSSAQRTSETTKEDAFADYLDGVLSIEDNGTTLIIDTHGRDDDPLGIGAFVAHCVYLNLGTPEWIQESVSTTRAMDGRQTAEWDNYKAQWNYHPDNGLGMIITETKGN